MTESDALRSYIETGTIRREGVTVTYWTERRFKDIQVLGGQRFDRSRHLSVANCPKVSVSITQVNFYFDERPVTVPLTLDTGSMQAEPGSVVAREIAFACRDPQAI